MEVGGGSGILLSVKVNVSSTHLAGISLGTAASAFDSTRWMLAYTLCFVEGRQGGGSKAHISQSTRDAVNSCKANQPDCLLDPSSAQSETSHQAANT